ncbi:hypothetical protein KKG72_06850 [bacterium]|nr:hypothetical protein [bacterium]MBU1993968.1 hypothetical protein [bacterium]
MNKSILRQALLFENETPVYSNVKELCELAVVYQDENNIYFLQAKRREKTFIKNEKEFFRFISQTQDIDVKNFEDIVNILNAETRSENIRYSGDSKTNIVKVFDNVVVVKRRGEVAKLYQSDDLSELEKIESFLAIENGETFLNIEQFADNFDEEYFVYLAGYANTLTRTFLKTKYVHFFLDFDIEGMNIYESFTCKAKKLHIPKNIQSYFSDKKYNNVALYKKQRVRMKSDYSQDVMPIIKLIKEYNTVVEQEILYAEERPEYLFKMYEEMIKSESK